MRCRSTGPQTPNGWAATHARTELIRRLEAEFARDPDSRIEWREEYGRLFTGRDGLLRFIEARWRLFTSTCREAASDPAEVARLSAELGARHAGLLALVERIHRGQPIWADEPAPASAAGGPAHRAANGSRGRLE